MIDDIVKDGQMVVCIYNDAIKVRGEYVITPQSDVFAHIQVAERLGYEVSHGICDRCYENTTRELKTYKSLENIKNDWYK